MKLKSYIKEHLFLYFLTLLAIIVIIISYFHFIIKQDYIVWYEGECDSATEICFKGCDDDACSKEYYYSKVQKYAQDLFNECGKDITNCESANICLKGNKECSVTYCNPEIDGVDTCTVPELIDESSVSIGTELSSSTNIILPDSVNE